MFPRRALPVLCLVLGLAPAAQAENLCTALADAATGKVLSREGKGCESRVTPASTFKIAIALMGYDAGILVDATQPSWAFKPGYPAWREPWKRDTDPTYWMKESVVWYSQQVTTRLGEARFKGYVGAFGYGNQDVSGDKGKRNGLTRAWLSSSLAISPLEQLAFLGRMLNGKLPVSPKAVAMTAAITRLPDTPNGWEVHGKTGMGFALDKAGRLERGRPYDWFVGWASKGGRTVTFARLDRVAAPNGPDGPRTRDALLAALPDMLEKAQ